MTKIFIFFFFAVLSRLAFADAPPMVTYELRNLKPVGLSHYTLSGALSFREYLRFQNEAGNHHFLYEEYAGLAPLKEVGSIQQAVNSADFTCSADVECVAKAFCLNSCGDMYYELTNQAALPVSADENRCRVTSFSCSREIKLIPPAQPAVPASAGAQLPANSLE